MNIEGDPHIIGVLNALSAAIDSIRLLPKCDIVVQIDDILKNSVDILIDYCEEENISTNEISRFIDYTDEIKKEVRKLYAAQKR